MNDSDLDEVLQSALRFLAASAKSRDELEKKLLRKGFNEAAIQNTITKLEKNGLINDRSYAENLVNRFLVQKPSGLKKISFELKRRGIKNALREEILAEQSSANEAERALELAEAKWRQFARLTLEKKKKKIYDLLIRRGFEFQIAKETLDKLAALTETSEDS